MKPIQRTVALCLGFIALVVGLFFYSTTRPPVLSAEELRSRGVWLLPTPREIAAFQLTDHLGRPYTPERLRGQWSLVFFGFTHCPDVCPTTLSVMAQAQLELAARNPDAGMNFQGTLISVDPERDDAERLSTYVGAFSANFVGATGELRELAAFARSVNVAFGKVPSFDDAGVPDENSYQVDHTANIVIVNPQGHYQGFIKYPQQAATIVATITTLATNF